MIAKMSSALVIASLFCLAAPASQAAMAKNHNTSKAITKQKMVKSHNRVMHGEGLSRRDNM